MTDYERGQLAERVRVLNIIIEARKQAQLGDDCDVMFGAVNLANVVFDKIKG